MIKQAISLLVELKDLTGKQMNIVFRQIMDGQVTPAQIGAFITALRLKGETVDEIVAAAQVMREKVKKVDTGLDTVIDTCGTGGDAQGTINISTLAAILCASCGAKVAKHGNRSVSSLCGSADLLEGLGMKLDLTPAQVRSCLEKTGFGFMFAPSFHPAMKHAIGPRREIGIRTVFNILGPLTNPAGARYQLMGVFSPQLTEPLAQVLKNLGSKRVMVVHGADGLDEISICQETQISELLASGEVKTYNVHPRDFGLASGKLDDIKGSGPAENVEISRKLLKGECGGVLQNAVCLNAAFALKIAGIAEQVQDGLRLCQDALASGKALAKMEQVIDVSNSV